MEQEKTADHQHDFICSVFLSNAQAAAFQRGNVYSLDSATRVFKALAPLFVKDLHAKLWALETTYKNPVTEEKHIENLQRFADDLSAAHAPVLHEGRFRIGTAQKAMNLYLKYLWCAGWIPEPPHCPIDRIILTHLGIENVNWTSLDDIGKYRKIMEKVRERAGGSGSSIAVWELELWK